SDEERDEAQRIQVVLGSYWRDPREVFARLVEQYVADKLGRENGASELSSNYEKWPGWWSKEEFAKLRPMVEAEIQKRMDALKSRYSPAAPEESPVAVEPPRPEP